jgi:hypothetical protein
MFPDGTPPGYGLGAKLTRCDTDPVEWDEVVGKYILVGLTYVDGDDQVIRQEQKHGLVVEANDSNVTVRPGGSLEEFSLPPDLEAFELAGEGEYTLRGTGEVITDPDLVATWTIRSEPGD